MDFKGARSVYVRLVLKNEYCVPVPLPVEIIYPIKLPSQMFAKSCLPSCLTSWIQQKELTLISTDTLGGCCKTNCEQGLRVCSARRWKGKIDGHDKAPRGEKKAPQRSRKVIFLIRMPSLHCLLYFYTSVTHELCSGKQAANQESWTGIDNYLIWLMEYILLHAKD